MAAEGCEEMSGNGQLEESSEGLSSELRPPAGPHLTRVSEGSAGNGRLSHVVRSQLKGESQRSTRWTLNEPIPAGVGSFREINPLDSE
ncbi:hypothetical protein EYF80_067250 [Liparis tanakae]|uniref:Uncharacterized protein n=1 Tax=Liparis tanakae TaxID=230148 RepID=A0A4Z2E1A0_9TELE|nr:hypothetical protein EYF80_067250 [Liparis tanakae]